MPAPILPHQNIILKPRVQNLEKRRASLTTFSEVSSLSLSDTSLKSLPLFIFEV